MLKTVAFLFAAWLSQAGVPGGSGRISGRVVADETNLPIVGARVLLLPRGPMSGPPGVPPQSLTNQDGRFEFSVPPGEYHVEVQKAGFASTVDPTQPPQAITVVEGQLVGDFEFRLQKGGAIAGRLLDEHGEPVVDAHVMAMRRAS